MNPTVLEHLASPILHHPLKLKGRIPEPSFPGDEIREGDLVDRRTGERFPILEGIPFLQPPGQVSDYRHQVLEIVFGASQKHLLAEIDKIGDPQVHREAVTGLIRDEIGKAGVWNAFRAYAEHSPESRLEWFLQTGDMPGDILAAGVSSHDIESGQEYAALAYGEQRAAYLAKMVDKWAVHLPRYARKVLEPHPETIVELGGGAGLGTDALLRKGLQDARLISIDIDFACNKTIEGLARWYKVSARVDPIVANFLVLPFRDASIDLVCAHYGLDESREVPRIIQEIGRILVPGGRFVNVSRSDPTLRLSQWLGDLDFSFDELIELATMSRLYPGPERLARMAGQQGLELVGREPISFRDSHNRTLFVFEKTGDSQAHP